MAFIHLHVFLDATELPQFSFDADALGMGALNYSFGNCDVFFEWFVARVDHNRTVEAGSDAIVTCLLVSVIEMNGKNHRWKHLFCRSDHCFKHSFVRIFSGTFRELNNEWGLTLITASE